jgi:hypothetical protein
MKAVHIALLALGTAIAGGLAVKMAEPPSLPPVAAPQAEPEPAHPVARPAPEQPAPPRKPAPKPRPRQEATAPPPVYTQPAPVKTPAVKPAPVKVARAAPPPAPPPVPYREPDPRRVTLPAGSEVSIRLNPGALTDRISVGDRFEGTLSERVIAGGFIVGERGAPVTGHVVETRTAAVVLRLLSFQTADGQRVEITTEPEQVTLPAKTVATFRLATRVTITERKL